MTAWLTIPIWYTYTQLVIFDNVFGSFLKKKCFGDSQSNTYNRKFLAAQKLFLLTIRNGRTCKTSNLKGAFGKMDQQPKAYIWSLSGTSALIITWCFSGYTWFVESQSYVSHLGSSNARLRLLNQAILHLKCTKVIRLLFSILYLIKNTKVIFPTSLDMHWSH